MAYADRNATGSRLVAGVIVAIVIVAVGYAFVTGLAYQYIKKATKNLDTFTVPPPPPPPPDIPPPPPPPDQPNLPPPPTTVVVPPPQVVTPQPAPPVQTSAIIPVQQPMAPPAPPAPPTPPAPPPPPPKKVVSQAAGLRGNLQQYYSADDYPSEALRAGDEGRVVAHLSVGTDGKVSACSIATSSGHRSLDDATCRIAERRVKFTPAKDQNGDPIASTFNLPVTWKVPE